MSEIRRELKVHKGRSSKGIIIGNLRAIRSDQREDDTIKVIGNRGLPFIIAVLGVLIGAIIEGDEDGIETWNKSSEIWTTGGRESRGLDGENDLPAWSIDTWESERREGFEVGGEFGSIAYWTRSRDTWGDSVDLVNI